MRLVIDGQTHMVHAIERTSPSQFIAHTQPGPAVGNMVTVGAETLGDALRARFDFLEQRVEGGDLEYLAVREEMEQISDLIFQLKV